MANKSDSSEGVRSLMQEPLCVFLYCFLQMLSAVSLIVSAPKSSRISKRHNGKEI